MTLMLLEKEHIYVWNASTYRQLIELNDIIECETNACGMNFSTLNVKHGEGEGDVRPCGKPWTKSKLFLKFNSSCANSTSPTNP